MVETNRLSFRNTFDDLALVWLFPRRKCRERLCLIDVLANDVVLLVDQRFHSRFDGFQIFRRNGFSEVDVVVEAIIDDRADRHLGVRVQLLDRVSQQMSTGMANDGHPFLIAGGQDSHFGVMIDDVGCVDFNAVYLAGNTRLGEPGSDGLGQLHDGNRLFKASLTAIRQRHNGHENILTFSGGPHQGSHELD